MGEMFFRQRNFLVTRSFMFESNGIRVLVQGPLKTENALVPYEYISKEPYELTKSSIFAFMLGVVFTILSVLMIYAIVQGHRKTAVDAFSIYVACAAFSFILFYIQRVQLVIYGQGEKLRLVLYKNKPSKETFEEAIHKIQDAKIKYLRETYLMNKVINIQTLNWLRSLGAVKQEEIERITNTPPNIGDSAL